MKVLVMGTGAVGGYFGGVLSKGGEDVVFVARGQHLEAIESGGLRVESVTSGDFTIHPPVQDKLDGSWQADLALFCVKGYQNEQAINTIRPAVGDGTTVLTLQNGIGSADQLANAFGRENVLSGAAYVDAMRKAPGVVAELGGECRIVFGEEDGCETERATRIRDTLHKVGIETHLSRNVSKVLWNKLIYICALSGMTCITRASFAEVMGTPETLDLTWRVMREAAEAGRAKGIDLDKDVVESTMAGFQEYKEDLISSMHLDLEAGNPLEIAFLNGAVSRIGKEVGVATPVNDFITACLSIADGKARRP